MGIGAYKTCREIGRQEKKSNKNVDEDFFTAKQQVVEDPDLPLPTLSFKSSHSHTLAHSQTSLTPEKEKAPKSLNVARFFEFRGPL